MQKYLKVSTKTENQHSVWNSRYSVLIYIPMCLNMLVTVEDSIGNTLIKLVHTWLSNL